MAWLWIVAYMIVGVCLGVFAARHAVKLEREKWSDIDPADVDVADKAMKVFVGSAVAWPLILALAVGMVLWYLLARAILWRT